MNKRLIRITLAFTAIASVGIAGVLLATPQHQEHHPEQGMQESAESQMGDSEVLPMCHRMMQHMMANMNEDMGMMQQMMKRMHAEPGATGHMGGGVGHMAGGEMPGLGTMQRMMHGMMGSMMQGLMAVPDTSSVEDPAAAEEQAQSLETQARLMRDYLELLDEHIEAFRRRAEELRKQS